MANGSQALAARAAWRVSFKNVHGMASDS
jgi:hypothetical protein